MTSRQLTSGLVVVTGGANGIGLALARAYGRRGAAVLIGDRDAEAIKTAVAALNSEGIVAHGEMLDVCDQDAVHEFASAAESLGPISIACLNAGVSGGGGFTWEITQNAYDFVAAANLWGVLNCIRSFVPKLISQQRSSHIVITASLAGLMSPPRSASYNASKAAAVALAKGLRAELNTVAPHVGVTCLAPAMVRTNLLQNTATQSGAAVALGADPAQPLPDISAAEVLPDDVAGWVLDAVDASRFWVLSPADDPFVTQLRHELDELVQAIHASRR